MASKRPASEDAGGDEKKARGAAKGFMGPANLEGTTFVVTGEFDMGKAAAEALIAKLGGKVVAAVSKSTSYCLLGKPGVGQFNSKTGPGTKKHKECKKKKIPIVDEQWLVEQSGDKPVSIVDLWERVVEAAKATDKPLDVAAHPGVSDDDIAKAEERLGFPLPGPLKELYKLSDGAAGAFSKLDAVARPGGGNSYGPLVRFYRSLGMVCISECVQWSAVLTCLRYVHINRSGVVWEWDTSFDGQCGNTIVADSLPDLLSGWAERLEAQAEKKDKASHFCNRPWRGDNEPDIDKSPAHASFFRSFKSACGTHTTL